MKGSSAWSVDTSFFVFHFILSYSWELYGYFIIYFICILNASYFIIIVIL